MTKQYFELKLTGCNTEYSFPRHSVTYIFQIYYFIRTLNLLLEDFCLYTFFSVNMYLKILEAQKFL